MVIITKKQTKPRHKNDFYETPYELAYGILERFFIYKPLNWLDAGFGSGVFGKAIRYLTDWSDEFCVDGVDIEDKTDPKDLVTYSNKYIEDFLQYEPPFMYDVVIGNPPYKHAEAFVRKAHECVVDDGDIIFLLKLAFLEGCGRTRGLYKELPPTGVHVLANRPSFDGTGHTNDYAFAIFHWKKRSRYDILKPITVLSWFDWKG